MKDLLVTLDNRILEDIPETINAGDLGELVFRIDKEKGNIRILKRIYSSKNDEEKENETRRK